MQGGLEIIRMTVSRDPIKKTVSTQSSWMGLRVCSFHITRSGTLAIRILNNIRMYGTYCREMSMRSRLKSGQAVTMATTSKAAIPRGSRLTTAT